MFTKLRGVGSLAPNRVAILILHVPRTHISTAPHTSSSSQQLHKHAACNMADQERAAKRQKKNMPDLSIDTRNTQAPNMIVDVCPDGDTVLVVQGLAGVAKPYVCTSSTSRSTC